MIFSLTNLISFGISAIVTLIVSIQVLRVYLQERIETLRYFACFLTTRLLFFLAVVGGVIAFVFFQNLMATGVLFVALWALVFVSLLFPPLLFTCFKWKKLRLFYFGILLGVGIVGTASLIVNFSPAQIMAPGIGALMLTPLAEKAYLFAKLVGILPLAILFLLQIRSLDRRIKIRSTLIGIGLVWVASTAFVPSLLMPIIPLVVGLYCCIGDILIFAGVKYHIPRVEEYRPKV